MMEENIETQKKKLEKKNLNLRKKKLKVGITIVMKFV
jgi:hypothetical protein